MSNSASRYMIELSVTLPNGDVVRDRSRAPTALVGRGPSHGVLFGIEIDAPEVSREHAELVLTEDGGLFVRDLGSRTGTFVGGERIGADKLVPLAPNGKLALGTLEAVARIVDSPVPPPPFDPRNVRRRPVPEEESPMSREARANLVAKPGIGEPAQESAPASAARPRQPDVPPSPGSSAVVEFTVTLPDGAPMTKLGTTVGRMIALGREFSVARPHLVAIQHPHVSQTHARLRVDDDGSLTVYDAGSTNGTSVNGIPVVGVGTKLGPDGTFHIANLRVVARVIGHEDGPAPSRSSESVSTRPEHASVTGYWPREACPIELEVARLKVNYWIPGSGESVGSATACAGAVYFGRFDKDAEHYVSINHSMVSYDHASIAIDKDCTISVYDMGSRNGTYVGGVRIHERTPLGPDGEFYLADVRVVVEFMGFVSTAPEPIPEPPPAAAGCGAAA